ncbi:EamA family transporter [Rhizobacter sp. Root404]|jgi:phosphonate utilization associated putative membrane protein|uniref:EamA family transporter n=1 Tax=Rhizobacter sp. Root404 TaxID=1736528 RepID=UPI0006F9536C|nr:EamA family transporter [Rhizobacter sp. Root404]KQW36963.1 phosphonate utilization protein [Rhizobacter sp. Root404]
MALTWPIVAAVLCAALLHASWNALIKSGNDKALDTALVHFLGALIALPFMLWIGLPPRSAWPFIAASLVIHIGYYIALVGAYQHGELGLTYPIMRGFAPMLVALASSAFIGEAPSLVAWLGIVGITLGVALVGLAHPGEALHHRKALMFAFANAAIIATYTVVDGRGVRESVADDHGAIRYVLTLFVLDGIAYPLLVWLRRSAQGRREIVTYARQRWPVAALGGSASIGAYGIALWAMTRAPVASVAALRETSVLFAALIGTVWLKERFGLQRAIGTGVIVAGVMALRFG